MTGRTRSWLLILVGVLLGTPTLTVLGAVPSAPSPASHFTAVDTTVGGVGGDVYAGDDVIAVDDLFVGDDATIYGDLTATGGVLGNIVPLSFSSNTLAQNDTLAVKVPFAGTVLAVSEDLFSGTLASTEAYNFTTSVRFTANTSQGSTPEIATSITNATFNQNDVLGIRVVGSVSSPLEYTGVIWIEQTGLATGQ